FGSYELLNEAQHFLLSSRRRHTRLVSDWSSDVCSSDLFVRHRAVRRRCCASDPWRAPSSIRSNPVFRRNTCTAPGGSLLAASVGGLVLLATATSYHRPG